MKNKIEDLRNHLFETIELLKDGDKNGMDVTKAKAIAGIGQTIINSAKVEIDYMKAVGGTATGSNFIPEEAKKKLDSPLNILEGKQKV